VAAAAAVFLAEQHPLANLGGLVVEAEEVGVKEAVLRRDSMLQWDLNEGGGLDVSVLLRTQAARDFRSLLLFHHLGCGGIQR